MTAVKQSQIQIEFDDIRSIKPSSGRTDSSCYQACDLVEKQKSTETISRKEGKGRRQSQIVRENKNASEKGSDNNKTTRKKSLPKQKQEKDDAELKGFGKEVKNKGKDVAGKEKAKEQARRASTPICPEGQERASSAKRTMARRDAVVARTKSDNTAVANPDTQNRKPLEQCSSFPLSSEEIRKRRSGVNDFTNKDDHKQRTQMRVIRKKF